MSLGCFDPEEFVTHMSRAGGATGENDRGAGVTKKRLSYLTQLLPALTSHLAEMGVFCHLPFPIHGLSPDPGLSIQMEMTLQQTRSSRLEVASSQ